MNFDPVDTVFGVLALAGALLLSWAARRFSQRLTDSTPQRPNP